MRPDNTARATERQKSIRKPIGDAIARGLASVLCGYLAALCRLFVVTPESIRQQKPGCRGNTPPPTGGISSLGERTRLV